MSRDFYTETEWASPVSKTSKAPKQPAFRQKGGRTTSLRPAAALEKLLSGDSPTAHFCGMMEKILFSAGPGYTFTTGKRSGSSMPARL